MSHSVEQLARMLLGLQGQITTLANRPQLPSSAIPAGTSVDVVDPDTGQPIMSVGTQHDGTVAAVPIDGPVPPVPSAPVVESGMGLTITYDGRMASEEDRFPLDGEGVEAWVRPLPEPVAPDDPETEPVPDPGDDPDDPTPPEPVPELEAIDELDDPFPDLTGAQLVHTFPAAGGTATVALPVGGWMVALVSRTVPGRRSAPSAIAVGEVLSVLDPEAMAELEQQLEELGIDLDELKEEDLAELQDTMDLLTTVVLPQLGSQISTATDALSAAFPSGVFNVQAGIDGKGETIFQVSAPTGSRARPENLWVRKPDMKVHVYDVDQAKWVPATDPDIITNAQLIANAQTAADSAMTMATGRNRVTYTQVTIPNAATPPTPDATRTIGDIHRNRLSSGLIVGEWRWGGSTWSAVSYGDQILTSLDVGKLTAGGAAIDTAVINQLAVAIATVIELNADRVTAGEISTARLNAEAVAAAVGTFLALRADQITAVGAGFDEAVVNDLRAKLLVAQKILAGEIDTASLAADEAFIALLRTAMLIVGSVPPSALAVGVEELIPDPMWEQPDRHEVPQGTAYRWSTTASYRQGGQARTLWLTGAGLTSAHRLYLTDAPIPTRPGERFQLALDARRTSGTGLSPAVALEVLNTAGAVIGNVAVAAGSAQATGSMVTTDGVVVVPDGGFAVRPWIGADPAAGEPTTATWYVSRVSMRGVQASTTQTGYTTQITGRGVETLAPSQDPGVPGEPMTQLGAFESNGLRLASTSGDNAGDTTVVITDDGDGSFVEVSTDRLLYGGVELTELLGLDVDAEEESWDEPRPRGVLGQRTFADNRGPWTALTGVGYVGFVATPGRLYKITASGRVRNIATGAGVQVELRGLHSGSPGAGYPGPPSISWPEVGLSAVVPAHPDSNSRWVGFEKSWYWTPDPAGTVLKPARMLLCLTPPEGGSVAWAAGGTLAVEDVGLVPATASGWHMGGSSGGGGGNNDPAPPDPTPTKTRKTSGFGRAWLKSWEQNGSSPNAIAGKAMQGYTRHWSSAGIYRSMVGFNNMTGTLSPVLAADIEKIEIEIKNGYAYPTTFVVGVHGATSAPGSFSQVTSHGTVPVTIGAGKSGRVVLPSSTHSAFKSGGLRGITLLAPSTASQYYGWGTQFTARVTYRS